MTVRPQNHRQSHLYKVSRHDLLSVLNPLLTNISSNPQSKTAKIIDFSFVVYCEFSKFTLATCIDDTLWKVSEEYWLPFALEVQLDRTYSYNNRPVLNPKVSTKWRVTGKAPHIPGLHIITSWERGHAGVDFISELL